MKEIKTYIDRPVVTGHPTPGAGSHAPGDCLPPPFRPRKPRADFVMGISMPWLEQVATLNPIDFKVAVCVWWQGGYNKFSGFICSESRRSRLGINRWSYHRSLKLLEAKGLVTIERKPHACWVLSIPERWWVKRKVKTDY